MWRAPVCTSKGAWGGEVISGLSGNGDTSTSFLQGVIRGQVRNLKSLEDSGASHWDSDSPERLSTPRSGHRTKLFPYWFLSCPSLSPPCPRLAPCQQRAMCLGRAGSLGPQATVQARGGCGRAPRSVSTAQAINPRPGHGHRASRLT